MAGPADFGTIVTAILNYQNQTIIGGVQPNNPTSPISNMIVVGMLMGAGLESGWNIKSSGGGAFQIIDHVNFDPTDINAAVAYMYPRYQAAATIDAALPENSAKYADIAYKAERPAKPYAQAQGQQKVDSVYQTVLQNYGSATAVGSASVQTIVGGGFLAPVLNFLGDLTDIRVWRSLGWIAVGIAFLILGLVIWLRKPIQSAIGTVAKGGL